MASAAKPAKQRRRTPEAPLRAAALETEDAPLRAAALETETKWRNTPLV